MTSQTLNQAAREPRLWEVGLARVDTADRAKLPLRAVRAVGSEDRLLVLLGDIDAEETPAASLVVSKKQALHAPQPHIGTVRRHLGGLYWPNGRAPSSRREQPQPWAVRLPYVTSPQDRILLTLVERYLAGDRSPQVLGEIEGVVVQSFQEAEWYDEVSEALSLYAPGELRPPYTDDGDIEDVLFRLRQLLG